jgi:hypothetical protein
MHIKKNILGFMFSEKLNVDLIADSNKASKIFKPSVNCWH